MTVSSLPPTSMPQVVGMTPVLHDQSMRSYAMKHLMAFIWWRIVHSPVVLLTLKGASWLPSRLASISEAQLLRLRRDLHMIASFFLIVKQLSGVCDLSRVHLDASACHYKSTTKKYMLTSLKFVSIYTIYAHDELGTMKFRRCIC